MKPERRRFLTYALAATSILAAGLGTSTTAFATGAPTDATVDVMQLQGTQEPGPGSIDPRVASVPQLKRPPLSAYNTYKLLSKLSQSVKIGTSATYQLTNGRTLNVTIEELTKDNRYRVLLTITEANAKDYLKKLEMSLSPNEPFFLAGQYVDPKDPSKGGLILGITLFAPH